ncbi:uncharacterized protein [Eurosta solidaginis]|uniref:uncharacterized protein n=1 Tax=Eurosta solidaginis TaxID=178769 RepID=UPI003530CC02
MAIPDVQVTCNWNQIGGCELSQSVQLKVSQSGVFLPPNLDTILETENAILFKQNGIKEPCAFRIQLQQSLYMIGSISIVSTVQKLEVFLGAQNEYTKDYTAKELEHFEEDAVFTFRHDVEIRKSDITELLLNLLPASTDEICIFGIVLQVALNPIYIDCSKFWWSKSELSQLYLNKKEATALFGEETKALREKSTNLSKACALQPQRPFDIDLENENHEKPTVQVVCNWKRAGGCELTQNVRYEVTHEYIFIPPALNMIVGNENAIILKHDDNIKEPCEVHLKLQPTVYKIEDISIVSTVEKIEVFLGALNEYMDTFNGEALEDKRKNIVFTYRHDIQVQRSGITEVILKFISSAEELCIFGTVLQIAPNPNGITTGPNIDFAKLLGKPGSSPRTEACLLFLEKVAKKQDFAHKNQANASTAIVAAPTLDSALKTYLDKRFEQLELKINERIDKAIAEQNAKLDKILDMLENKTI